jgi:flagellin
MATTVIGRTWSPADFKEEDMASFSVVNNIASANAQANLQTTQVGLQKSLTRLSSGFRINASGDDAAGLVVANTYRTDVAIVNQGIRNANDGLSDLQIKDGALANVATLLDRLATLAAQAASGTTKEDSFGTLDDEFQDVIEEIDREVSIAGLDSQFGFSVFVSADTNTDGDLLGIVGGSIAAVDTGSLGIDDLSLDDAETAQDAVSTIKDAISTLGESQAKIGTLQNRLQFAIGLAQSQSVSTKAAESRIRDANIAEESANMTRYNILTQSGVAALAQANQSTSSVLSLLR